jgi:hypothetical protein
MGGWPRWLEVDRRGGPACHENDNGPSVGRPQPILTDGQPVNFGIKGRTKHDQAQALKNPL